MTRINVGVLPQDLPSKLLQAELREIKRVPNVVKSGKYSMDNQPKEFTLGAGHVKFFYDKLGYLRQRYQNLRKEAIRRGINATDFSTAWEGVPLELMGYYTPNVRDRQLIVERIRERGFDVEGDNLEF